MTVSAPAERVAGFPEPDAPIPYAVWDFIRTSGLPAVVHGPSKDPNAKITVLLLSPESGHPALAVKSPTTRNAAAAVEAEARVLVELDRLAGRSAGAAIPRVVAMLGFEGRTAVAMTAVPGVPMSSSYLERRHTASRERAAADFAAVSTWLADFQRATAGEQAPLEMDGEVTTSLRARFGDEEHLGDDLERLAEIHARLRCSSAPRTAVHGDFWFGNVLLADGRVTGVVDWEAGATAGEPVRDLVRFALMYALYLDARTRSGRRVAGHPGLRADGCGAGVEFALNGEGWFPELFRSFLGEGLARLGASAASWRDAALAGIAEVAAFTDEPAFAQRHLELFRRLTGTVAGRR